MSACHHVTYTHAVLEGSAREVGLRQAEWIAQRTEVRAFFISPHPERGPLPAGQAKAAIAFFERHCPGLNEEIHGFAEGLGVPPEQIIFYALSYDPPAVVTAGHCSHMVVRSGDGHVRVARSYEFSHAMSDLRLVTTRIQGRAAHVGFSEALFGRNDGLNEHGLCVTMSAGAPMAPAEAGGCLFWAMVRTVLDRCVCVDEALEVIAGIPLSFNLNLMLADRSGQAALVEMASSCRSIRRMSAEEPCLVATNHFTAPELRPFDLGRRWNSVERQRIIRTRLVGHDGGTTIEVLRGILSELFPQGVCCHAYNAFFGTLWSEIFDLTAGTLEVCFGSPACNPWHTVDLRTPSGVSDYPVVLPEMPADAQFWLKLGPGCES